MDYIQSSKSVVIESSLDYLRTFNNQHVRCTGEKVKDVQILGPQMSDSLLHNCFELPSTSNPRAGQDNY